MVQITKTIWHPQKPKVQQSLTPLQQRGQRRDTKQMKIGQRLRIKRFLRRTVNERPFLSKNLFKKYSRQNKSLSMIQQKQSVPQDSKDHHWGRGGEANQKPTNQKNPTQKSTENITYLETTFSAIVFLDPCLVSLQLFLERPLIT